MYRSVIEEVLRAYRIKYAEIHAYQKGYRNEIWPVRTIDGQMINVTFYKREPGIIDRIRCADATSEYLETQAMPTRRRIDPRILQLKSGKRTTYVGVYTYLPGRTIPWEAYTMTHIKLLGKTMSDMHAKLAGMKPNNFPFVYDEYHSIIKRMESYFTSQSVQGAIQQKLQLKVDTAHLDGYKKILQKCQILPGQQVLHMDFVRGNILFDIATSQHSQQLGSQAISGILDFEKTAVGSPVVDIARTLAFLLVDCKYKSAEKVEKYFLYSGYQKRGASSDIGDDGLRRGLVELFLLYDFYKFLRHNPYESLGSNEHYVRTRDILLKQNVVRYVQ